MGGSMKLLVESFVIVITMLIFVWFITPYIKDVAFYIGAVDKPSKRKIHKKAMPRLGGLAIYFGFLLGCILFCPLYIEMIAILIGSFIIIITGIVDDITSIKPRVKLLAQIIAALIIVFYGNIVLDKIVLPFNISFHFSYLGYFLTVIYIIFVINSINLIDGLDGLAAGVSSIFFLTLSIIAGVKFGADSNFVLILSLIMLGSTLGFLIHNFHPAKIFMGDTGSLFLGFIIAVISLLGFKSTIFLSIIVPIVILAIPILDTICAFLRRVLSKKSFSTPDKEHIHHQLLKINNSQIKTVLTIYIISFIFSAIAIIYALWSEQIAVTLFGIMFIFIAIFVSKTNILGRKNKKRS